MIARLRGSLFQGQGSRARGAPGVCGVDARNLGELQAGQSENLSPALGFLRRRLRHEEANAAQFFVSENHLLALIIVFDVT